MKKKTNVPEDTREYRLCGNLDRGNNKVTRHRINQFLEVLIVFLLVLLAWGFFSLPIIFRHVNISQNQTKVAQEINKTNETVGQLGDSQCSALLQYNKNDQICQSELLIALSESSCLPAIDQTLLVVRNGQQFVNKVLLGLQVLNARESCILEATAFLCLYAYGLCTSSGMYIQPTSSQCEEIRDSLCQTEWKAAINFGINLPNCNELPSGSVSCQNFRRTNSSISNIITEDIKEIPSSVLLECSDGFYRENNSEMCVPSCYSWHQFDYKLSVFLDVALCLTGVIGTIACIIILVLAFLNPKKMCIFPAILIVYMVVDVLILYILIIIGFMDRSRLYCSSRNLLESLRKVTPYCIITGMYLTYVLVQLSLWWFFHTSVLFWKVMFPFHSQRFTAAGKLKYVHVLCLFMGLLIPLGTIIAAMSQFGVQSANRADNMTSAIDLFISGGLGYETFGYPPILCANANKNVGVYSLVIPIGFLQSTGSSLLIIVIWQIHKQSSNRKSSNFFKFGTAEKKLLIAYIYFGLLIFMVMLINTIGLLSINSWRTANYFLCEVKGHDPENPCDRSGFSNGRIYSFILLTYVIVGLYPTAILVYAINVKETKKFFKKKMKKGSSSK